MDWKLTYSRNCVYSLGVNQRPNRLSLHQIREIFQSPNRPPFLDFSPPVSTTESTAIKARSGAVEKAFKVQAWTISLVHMARRLSRQFWVCANC